MPAGRPPLFNTAEELEKEVEQYFSKCGMKPITKEVDGVEVVMTDTKGNPVMINHPATVAGLALYLGFESRQSIYDMKGRSPELSYIIKRAILAIENQHETSLSTSGYPTGSIFWLKNHKWSDKQDDGPSDVPPMNIHINGRPDPKDLDPEQNDNLDINEGSRES